jgi:hypothetical protein
MAGLRRSSASVLLVALVLAACSTSPTPGNSSLPFDQPANCKTSGPPASAAERAHLDRGGIRGTFIVHEAGSGTVKGDRCPTYRTYPPADGAMAVSWANCGFYDHPVSPPHAVRSLINGAVWIAYDPRLPAAQVRVIRHEATRSNHVLASPVRGLGAPVVMTAWKRQLWLPSVRDARFDDFIDRYLFEPDRPNVYTSCRDGRGAPERTVWDGA